MKLKASIMDEAQLERSMARIAHEIIEKNNGAEGICLLGIKRRGIPLAEML
ncbi:MAG: bifunctional pyr operon transcriptional regulator/uracil phosphoribosyltransferase, partial [Lachnospiraceae bacterium]|nr:bifunctional pyr operon transcriptional regulator/uracil phosphoribosyltransferase [Lachnospiraceae bacterium]